MAWFIRRAALLLCFSLGTSLWYLLTQTPSLTSNLPELKARAAQETAPPVTVPSDVGPRRNQEDDSLGQTIKFGPAPPASVSINVNTLVLRESASSFAPVVARLKIGKYENAELLEATKDFVRVKVAASDGTDVGGVVRDRDYEGWTTWNSIVPTMTAIVLDAETGALVGRVPLDYDVDSVTFSPDGSKALFYSSNGGTFALEVRTSDYTYTRTLTSPTGENFATPFYGPDGKDLYVAAYRQGNAVDSGKVSLISIGPNEGPNLPTAVTAEDYNFVAVSPDGSKVFVARNRQQGDYEMKVDVYDVMARQFVNTLTLTGTELPWSANSFVLSADGTELYVQLSEKSGTISVIDTRTGQRVREMPTPGGGWFHLSQQNLVGNSLLIPTWDYPAESEQDTEPLTFWVGGREVVKAARGIFNAVETEGRRYAVNGDGTRFFQLDEETNGIAASFQIPRPEIQRGSRTEAADLTTYGLSISPDGKHVILFVGFIQGC